MLLPGCRGGGRHPFLPSLLCEDTSRTAERTGRCNCGRASLPRRSSGARSPAKNQWPGSRRRRLSASVNGLGDLRTVSFSLGFSFFFPLGSHKTGRWRAGFAGRGHTRERPMAGIFHSRNSIAAEFLKRRCQGAGHRAISACVYVQSVWRRPRLLHSAATEAPCRP